MAVKEIELTTLWERVIEEVAVDAPQHRAFLQLTKPLGLLHNNDQTTLLVAAPNLFAKDVLESRLRTVVCDVLTRELGDKASIAVTVDETLESAEPQTPEVDIEFVASKVGTGREEAPSKNAEVSQLNSRYIFETFVIGASNRFAHAAAVAVAEAPAKAYNPLFIYGESGLGKTHLLHAIGAYAKELYGSVRVRYVSSEEFTNDFINSIRDDKATAFQRRYRDLDVLLVDDIQFLENKERTQEEFFHTFNTLYNANKQIVISSDRPPKQLTTLEDRLRSRFEWGLITDIQPPELETRIAILRKKAAQDKLNAPDDVLEYLRHGDLTMGHARALVPSENPSDLAKRVISGDLSVRETERLAKGPLVKTGKPAKPKAVKDSDTNALEGDLAANLGMKVSIDHTQGKESGKVTISYKDLDQLDSLLGLLSSSPLGETK